MNSLWESFKNLKRRKCEMDCNAGTLLAVLIIIPAVRPRPHFSALEIKLVCFGELTVTSKLLLCLLFKQVHLNDRA